jgi:sterol-4alpha-carboxylate 3-dehydrogenase (decarboxylating)
MWWWPQARAGKMKYIIGNGKNLMDWTYVGNVAQSHLDVSVET